MKKVSRLCALLFFAIVAMSFFTGCQQTKPGEGAQKKDGKFPVTITDVYGSTVTIEKEPQRIIALAPSIVEVLYELGLQDKIVGVTDYCDYPAQAKEKNKVGSFNGLNIEKIVEAKPDLILAGTGISKEDFQKLTDLKMKVVVTEAKTFSQIPETFMMMGKATGTEDKAKNLTDELTKKIDDIKVKAQDAKKVRTYYVLSFGKAGNWTAGKGTFISDLINIAGGENISDDVEGWKEYNTEKIVEKNPEVVLVSAMVANGTNKILDNENGYKDLRAVKCGNVVVLDDNLTQRPGPRIAEGLELIAKAIHPEIFK